jgi:hypothetical protein
MTPSNGPPEPTERTSLLQDDAKKPLISNGNSAGSESGEDPKIGSVENTDVEENGGNGLFEGNEEMKRRMLWIFPATSVGVSFFFSLLFLRCWICCVRS